MVRGMMSLIAKGAQIGVTVFFAVLVFVLCCGVFVLLLALIAKIIGRNGEDD